VLVKKAADDAYLKEKLPHWAQLSDALEHYENCQNTSRWLPRGKDIPKATRSLLPLPKHPEAADSCPGCACAIYHSVMIKIAKSMVPE
jgi:hypothetical protein